jgi:hypothetical protein
MGTITFLATTYDVVSAARARCPATRVNTMEANSQTGNSLEPRRAESFIENLQNPSTPEVFLALSPLG